MMNRNIEDKLIILYVLSKIKIGLTREQIALVVLSNMQLSYFDLQLLIDDLVSNGFITENNQNDSAPEYTITPSGAETLTGLSYKISSYLKEIVDEYIKNNQDKILRESVIDAYYNKTAPNHYQVHLLLMENKIKVLELNLDTPDAEQAAAICEKWRHQTQRMYASMIDALINDYS